MQLLDNPRVDKSSLVVQGAVPHSLQGLPNGIGIVFNRGSSSIDMFAIHLHAFVFEHFLQV